MDMYGCMWTSKVSHAVEDVHYLPLKPGCPDSILTSIFNLEILVKMTRVRPNTPPTGSLGSKEPEGGVFGRTVVILTSIFKLEILVKMEPGHPGFNGRCDTLYGHIYMYACPYIPYICIHM